MTDSTLRDLDRRANAGDELACREAARLRHKVEPTAGHLHAYAFKTIRKAWLPRIEYVAADGRGVCWGEDEDDGYGFGEAIAAAKVEAESHVDRCLAQARDGLILAAWASANAAMSLEADTIQRGDAWGELSDLMRLAVWRTHQRAQELFEDVEAPAGLDEDDVFSTYANDEELDQYLSMVDGWVTSSSDS